MKINWFDVEKVVGFAGEVSEEADKILRAVSQSGKAHADRKDQKRFDSLIARVATFVASNRLNFYKKARFLNTIKWKLRDAGHDEELVDELVSMLTAALNRR
jgi:hypothetical protein